MDSAETAMSDPKPPPISALKALEPRPGGHWTIYEQEGDATSLSYVMDNGTESITYALQQCKTEEEIRKYCAAFVYEYTDVFESGYDNQNGREVSTEFGNTHEATSQIYHAQSERSARQYSTSQTQQPLQQQFLFNTQAAIISPSELQTQASHQFEETALAPQSQLYQKEQGFSISNDQQLSQESFASGAAEWPLSNNFFSTTIENSHMSVPSTESGVSQDTAMLLNAWQQNWVHVNPSGAQGSDGEWDAFFPHP